MSLFQINAKNARLERFIPKHGKSEDATRTAELQFRNVVILPKSAQAVLLGEGDGNEVEAAFFVGSPPMQRFFGIAEIASTATFENRHTMTIEGLDGAIRVARVDKIRLRFEGGPNRIVWADLSVHVEDPSAEEVDFFHDRINRDVSLLLKQDADLIDEMRAKAKGMSVSTTVQNGEFDLNKQADADKERADHVAEAMKNGKTAEIPLRGAKRKSKPAKKSSSRKVSRGLGKKKAG